MSPKYEKKDSHYVHQAVLEKLQEFGLTPREARIYLYLNYNGPKKAKDVALAEKIPRTRTYRILSKMKEKGVIDILNDRPKKFFVNSMGITLDSLIQFEHQKITEMYKMKKVLIPLWNQTKRLTKYNRQKFSDKEKKLKKYADSQKFREEFRKSMRHLLSKPDKRYEN